MFFCPYVGLPSHPQYELVKRQSTGCPGMITFYIKGTLEHATAFLSNLKVIVNFYLIWTVQVCVFQVANFVIVGESRSVFASDSQTETADEGRGETAIPQLHHYFCCFSLGVHIIMATHVLHCFILVLCYLISDFCSS